MQIKYFNSIMIRFDLIYTYWILTWYILYELGIISYNPLFWLLIALAVNLFNLVLMVYFKRYLFLFLFTMVTIVIKGIPIWTLRKTTIKTEDILFGAGLYIIYLCWILYNKKTPYKLYIDSYNSIKYNNPSDTTPFIYLMKQMNIIKM